MLETTRHVTQRSIPRLKTLNARGNSVLCAEISQLRNKILNCDLSNENYVNSPDALNKIHIRPSLCILVHIPKVYSVVDVNYPDRSATTILAGGSGE
jgi:hypothetical protein